MKDSYESPLCNRYAGKRMQYIFSSDNKFCTWRKLWLILAESEKELGLAVTDEQISELRAHLTDIDYEKAAEYEKLLRHDVMAHIRTLGDACPKAKPIIHLGATSCYVGDNTDVIVLKSALLQIRGLLLSVISKLSDFAAKYADMPCLAFTHFQAAQPTTLGKRATLWLNDLTEDLDLLDFELNRLALLGCKGTTGTGASFLELFGGDKEKVYKLERLIADKLGFDRVCAVSGQTYSRKTDAFVLNVLSSIAQSAQKFSNDFRLLSHLKEVDEPFESNQVGSSAMAYKRNPMRSERIAALCRYVILDAVNPAITASGQWLERTLDDSANRRISIPEAFLATDGILNLYYNVIGGCKVYPKMMKKHLNEELPFMATENILMYCVAKGGDRQELHERIRIHSVAAGLKVKEEGGANDLADRIAADDSFKLSREELNGLLNENNFTGLASDQTARFLSTVIAPLLKANSDKAIIPEAIEV